jgi:phosphoglycerate dehydrogenase-like enzyme
MIMQRVVYHHDATAAERRRLDALRDGGLDVVAVPPGEEDRHAGELAAADLLWHVLAPATAGFMATMPKLRLVQKIGVGVNTIDLEAARARGIPVCNMPGTNSRAVAEMTLGLMLACLRRLPTLDALVRAGSWVPDETVADGLGEIGGRTVGLIGYGAIPWLLAPILAAMGADVVYWSRTRRADAVGTPVRLAELLERSHIVSLHLPLVPETERLIDAAALARMRPGSILVNTARGGLVDEAALMAALRTGPLACAGLDVFAEEPVPEDHPLAQLRNVVLAPHLAWRTVETFERSLAVAVENSRRLALGRDLLHRVV